MNILHVIQNLDDRQGGPVTVLQGLARAQTERGHRVSIYTTGKKVKRDQGLTSSPIDDPTVFSFPPSIKPILFSFNFLATLRKNICIFDIVHIHGLYRFPVTFSAWLARKQNIPYIIRPHGSLDPFLYKQSRFGQIALPLKRLYEWLFDIPNMNNASAIHYTSTEEMERASFLKLRAPAVIIPNGIDWELFSTLPEPRQFRRTIGVEPQTPLVLFLGRINFKKGLDLLVPSFSQVVNKFPNARLCIVGPDNEGYGSKVRQWCRETAISDKVIFVDHLDPIAVRQAYVDADVFVLPSYTENFGMTVVEAMACGCPVVISDQVNIWREVKEEGAGLVMGLDPALIADAICNVLSDKDAADQMGRRGRLAAEKRYSWSRIIDQITDMYQRLIEINVAAKHRMRR